MKKSLTLAVAALVGVVAAYLAWQSPVAQAPRTQPESAGGPSASQPAEYPVHDAVEQSVANHEAADPLPQQEWPASLLGSEIDGAVEIDAQGRLRPSLSLRRLFDHLLSSIGERSPEQIRAMLATYLQGIADPAVRAQVLALFERYVGYLQEVSRVAPTLQGLSLQQRLDALVALRRQWLGVDVADSFFGIEEAHQSYTLAQRELQADSAISADEREQREQALFEQLPPELRAAVQEHRAVGRDLEDANAIDLLASDANERARLRQQRYGEEAAARLQVLDQERAAWDARVAALRQEQARIAQANADAARREAAFEDYLQRHFSEPEQRRLRSLRDIGEL